MRPNKLLLLLFFISSLQACLPNSQIEELAIINTRGVDLLEEDGEAIIETTIIPYIFDPHAQEITVILSGKGNTIKGSREDAAKKASYELTPGQIRLELYGKEAAESGILSLVNTLVRDARVSEMMLLAVTNQKAKEVLESEQSVITINTAQYLEDLITKEIETNTLPQTTLHEFTRIVEQVGIDAVLPVLDVVENFPTLVGAALLHQDKYVEEISLQEAFLINQIRGKVSETSLDAVVPVENYKDSIADITKENQKKEKNLHIFLSLVSGKSKLRLINQESMHYKAEIKMKAEILETSTLLDVKTESTTNKLEKDLSKFFTKQYEELFSKLQEVNSDAFGLGKLYNSTRKGSKLTNEEWRKQFPETTMEFQVDITILNTGTID